MGGEAKQYQVVLDPKRLAGYRLSLGDVESILERNNASRRRRLHREERRVVRHPRRRAVPQHRGHREHRRRRPTPTARRCWSRTWRSVRIGAALRFGAVTKHGEGEIVAGTVMMLTGANSREVVKAVKAQLAEIQKRAAGGRGDPLVLRPRRVHRPHAAHRGHQPGRGRGAGGRGAVPHARQLARLADRGAGDPAGDGHRRHRHGAARRHRQPHVARRDRLRAAGRRRHRDAGGRAARARACGAPPSARTSPTLVAQAMGSAARPVAFSLSIILLVYLPLMALEGVEGRMFKPMAITVALALGGALAVLADGLPGAGGDRARVGEARTTSRTTALFGGARRLLRAGCSTGLAEPDARRSRRPRAALVLARRARRRTLGAEFVPRLDEGELSLDVKRLPSISITEAQRLGRAGRGGAGALPRGALDRDAHRPRRGGDRSGRPRRDRGDGQARAPRRSGRPRTTSTISARSSRRPSSARCRRRSSRCRSRSRIASTSCWPARAPTSSSRSSATIWRCSSGPPTRSAGRARRARPRRLARAARARAAAARGDARSARLARYGDQRRRVLEVVEASRVGPLRRQDLREARAAST